MRQWLEAGYFKGDLPVSQQAGGPFLPLQAIYPDISKAFVVPQADPAAEEAAARAAAEEDQRKREEEQRRAEEIERQKMEEEQRARAEQEAREAAERERIEKERLEKEAAAAASTPAASENGANEPSNQLKMMLGLGSQQPPEEPKAEAPGETKVEKQPPAEKGSSKKGGNKKNNKNQPAPAPAAETPEQPAAPPAKPAAPAWGGAAQANQKRKSMSEIQKEEARQAAVIAAQRGNQPRQSSGWANVAATGSSAWSGGAVKPTAAAVVGQNPATAPGRGSAAQVGGRSKNAGASGRKPTGQQRGGASASTTAAEEFGTTMSPALEKWCKDQMVKLNGTDDLTLVSFCMTLNDATEIRQYLTTYLGSTPQVNNFATEFINKTQKGGPPPKQEEWETPGSAKKGRKKKGGR